MSESSHDPAAPSTHEPTRAELPRRITDKMTELWNELPGDWRGEMVRSAQDTISRADSEGLGEPYDEDAETLAVYIAGVALLWHEEPGEWKAATPDAPPAKGWWWFRFYPDHEAFPIWSDGRDRVSGGGVVKSEEWGRYISDGSQIWSSRSRLPWLKVTGPAEDPAPSTTARCGCCHPSFSGFSTMASGAGYWSKLVSPFIPGANWGVGATPHGCSGWNGRPDFYVEGETEESAVRKAVDEFPSWLSAPDHWAGVTAEGGDS